MPSKFGGIAVEEQPSESKFGGISVQEEVQHKEEGGWSDKAFNVLSEFAAAINRPVAGLVDFLGTDTVNALLKTAGVDERVPSLSESIPGIQGGFMEPGMGRDIVRGAGEMTTMAALPQMALKKGAAMLPEVVAGTESIGAGVLRQVGQQSVPSAAGVGAVVGAGAEAGGEVGELVGGEEGRVVGEVIGGIAAPLSVQAIKSTAGKLVTDTAKRLLKDSAPTIEGLKGAARTIYGEIDDLGAVINSDSVNGLSKRLHNVVKNAGFNRKIHPKVAASLDEFADIEGTAQKVTEVDLLRRISQAAAGSAEPDERRLGAMLLDEIDSTMNSLKASDLIGGDPKQIGKMYKDARNLWSRASKAEMIETAFETAKNQASGFENGIRVQFRQILNNKKKLRGFNAEEISAMREVVRGTTASNFAKHLGKFGFSEGQAGSMLLSSLGVAGGAAVGGAAGAVVIPIVGQVSRKLAQKLTRGGAEYVNALVRSGNSGRKVVDVYLKNTRSKDRSVEDLAELLSRPNMNMSGIKARGEKMSKAGNNLLLDSIFYSNLIRTQREEEEQ